MAACHSIDPTLVRFARHLHARRGLAEITVQNYLSAICRLESVIGLKPTPKTIEQHIDRMHKSGALFPHRQHLHRPRSLLHLYVSPHKARWKWCVELEEPCSRRREDGFIWIYLRQNTGSGMKKGRMLPVWECVGLPCWPLWSGTATEI
jgi:hypothetical protein